MVTRNEHEKKMEAQTATFDICAPPALGGRKSRAGLRRQVIGRLQGAAKNATDVKNKTALSSERDAQDPSEGHLDDRRAAQLARTVTEKTGLVKLGDKYEMRIRRHSLTEQRHGHGHSMDTAAQFARAMLEAKSNVNSQYQSWGSRAEELAGANRRCTWRGIWTAYRGGCGKGEIHVKSIHPR